MKKLTFVLRIRQQYFLFRLVSGLCYIGGAIAGFLPGTAADIIQIFSFAFALFLAQMLHFSPKEQTDEMAEQNIAKAKALSADIIGPLLCFGTLVLFLLFRKQEDLSSIALWMPFLFVGIMDIIQAVAFKRLEDK
ncbi:MAG: hypothetical protein Q4A66_02090 [Eubacteriales bacterium]|nr:hypothetical protein [Eubacteriales bacterium]